MSDRKRTFADLEDQMKVSAWSDINDVRPHEVSMFNDRKVWFTCQNPYCRHDFLARVAHISMGKWCPFCSNRRMCDDARDCSVCILKTFYNHEDKSKVESWSPVNKQAPWQVFANSARLIWFDCKSCGHSFETRPNTVVSQDSWCKYCANMKLCDDARDCSVCVVKTFYNNNDRTKVDAWSIDNKLRPWQVFANSAKNVIFDCMSCGHTFESKPNTITSMNTWCAYCSHRKLCNSIGCAVCVSKSFYGYENRFRVDSWSERNIYKPWQVFMKSNIKQWFDCKVCGHEFHISPVNIVAHDHWCPYCSSCQICPNSRECVICLPKTFFSFQEKVKVDAWSSKNKKNPWDFFRRSNKKVWFHCNECVEDFECSLDHVVRGNWCPYCHTKRNKAMSALIGILDKLTIEHVVEETIKLDNRSLHWDASCTFEDTEFFIESDGPHHFSAHGVTQVSRGKVTGDKATKAFNDQRTRDLLKETYIRVNNGILFRFSYRQTSQVESLVSKMLEVVKSGKTGVFYMDDIYW